MIVFELTMPNVGSWNGKWSGANRRYIRVHREQSVPKELWERSFYYSWNDGWTACISVTRMPSTEARKLERKSAGFRNYDWMITSIIKNGCIIYDK